MKTYLANQTITDDSSHVKEVKAALLFISRAFKKKQPMLKKHSILTLARITIHLMNNYNIRVFEKEFATAYMDFEEERARNEELDETLQNGELAAYTDAARADDVPSMEYRYNLLLRKIIESLPSLEPLDPNRLFSEEQKRAIRNRDNNKCKKCAIDCTLDNSDIDHIQPHSKGGKTIISNGQLLCTPCNLIKGSKSP